MLFWVCVFSLVGTVVLAPAVLGLVGFTAGGIAAGSIAAGMMSSAAIANGGGIAAGSLVAVLQSVGESIDHSLQSNSRPTNQHAEQTVKVSVQITNHINHSSQAWA